MPKEKKRLSKNAKAAQKLLNDSRLLAAKATQGTTAGQEFRSAQVTPRTSTAIKLRPEKKKG